MLKHYDGENVLYPQLHLHKRQSHENARIKISQAIVSRLQMYMDIVFLPDNIHNDVETFH